MSPSMLPDIRDYDELRRAFRWPSPQRYNIAVDVCDRWATHDPARPAVLEEGIGGAIETLTFGALRIASNRLAHALRRNGVKRGDRVALLLPQSKEVTIAHMAIYKLGAIALPLATLFGVDALGYRLGDAGARAILTNAAGVEKIRSIEPRPAALDLLVSTDGPDRGALGWREMTEKESSDFDPVDTGPDDAALMIYTSGTTGNPKGALHAHRVLLGHMPGVLWPHEYAPQPRDLFWTPADWAWAGGLLDIMLPALQIGAPVVANRLEKFNPERALELMARFGVRNTLIPPTALRMLRAVPDIRARFDLNLRTLNSGGESLGEATLAWGREELGIGINEIYGQTECNLTIASCAAIGVVKPGTMGKAVPGHDVAIIHVEDGSPCAPGEVGQIAVRRPDPVMFLEYWGKPEATRDKFVGDWLKTGDQGVADEEGYIRFIGRDDDVITSAGFRIGPTEIEDCLVKHPAVALAAVVGKPDPIRTEIVKAFVVPRDGFEPSDQLAAEIQAFVRTRLSAHEYPREIAFRKELPLTTTGKVIRRLLKEEG